MDEDAWTTAVLERLAAEHVPSPEAYTTTLRRARRREVRGRVLAGLAAVVIAVAGLTAAWAAFGRRSAVPGTSPTPTSATERTTSGPPSSVVGHPSPAPTRLISSSRNRLVVEAPPGVYRWTFDAPGCKTAGHPVSGKGGGSGGGTCGGNAYLGFNGLALGLRDPNGPGWTTYDTLSGRTLPAKGIEVRVTFTDGTQTILVPHHGLWIVVVPLHLVTEPTGPFQIKSPFRSIDVLDASRRVIAHSDVKS